MSVTMQQSSHNVGEEGGGIFTWVASLAPARGAEGIQTVTSREKHAFPVECRPKARLTRQQTCIECPEMESRDAQANVC